MGKGYAKFFNNTFYGTDGIALEYQGIGDIVENNFFEYNDWSGANMNVAGGGKVMFGKFECKRVPLVLGIKGSEKG